MRKKNIVACYIYHLLIRMGIVNLSCFILGKRKKYIQQQNLPSGRYGL